MLRRALVNNGATLSRRFSTASPGGAAAGSLYICGTGESNKLGLGDTSDRETPTLVEGLGAPVQHVACGKYHTMALTASGDVYAWGLESSGQLGLGSARTKAKTPQKVEALSGIGVRQLSCGSYHTLALTETGEVWSCGFGGSFFNGAGGLGHGDRKQLDEPRRLAAFGEEAGVIAQTVSAGGYHSLAQDTDGGVWTWGRGEWGRLGHGDASDALVPTRVEECDELGRVVGAVAAHSHSACLLGDGQLYTWGRNEHWQLGYEVVGLLNSGQSFDAEAMPTLVPMPEAESARVVQFACGEQGSVAVLEDQSVWLWGMRRYFEPTRLPNAPGQVSPDDPVVDLQCGSTHVVLLTQSGRVFTYGQGTALALPKRERKSWEMSEVTGLEGRRVLQVACGSATTALIVAD